ncbi:MAG: deoxycytidylate deaminase [Ktedonobacterales bacterium]
MKRRDFHDYYLRHAAVAAAESSCLRRHVGAIIVVDRAIVSTGYNGTPFKVHNCDEGGCPRCASDAPSGSNYDLCFCVHAEANALALAARHGTSVRDGTLYTTLRPCIGCLKSVVQAGIKRVVNNGFWCYDDEEVERAYWNLIYVTGIEFIQRGEAV